LLYLSTKKCRVLRNITNNTAIDLAANETELTTTPTVPEQQPTAVVEPTGVEQPTAVEYPEDIRNVYSAKHSIKPK
jgi:hypothetical protein